MKKNIELCLKLLVSLSFAGQSVFADPVVSTLPPAAIPAPASAAASAPAEPSSDAYYDILFKPKVGKQAFDKILNGEKHYTITLAEGNGPQDDDVLITRRVGKVYSFRFCKAHVPNLAENPIDQIKKLRFSNPDVFRNQSSGNTVESDKLLEALYNSDACDKSHDSFYALIKIHWVRGHQSDATYGPPIGYSAGGFVIGGIFGAMSAYRYSEAKNTLSFVKKSFSGRTPFYTAASIGFLGGAGWFAYHVPSTIKQADQIDSVANASYAFVYGPFNSNSTESMTGSDNYVVVENVVPSMAEFKINFEKGLAILLNDRTMTRF